MLGNWGVSERNFPYLLGVIDFSNRRTFTDGMKDRMSTARDLCLGPRDQRSRCAPTKTAPGKYVGGTAIERNGRAIPVHIDTRCYTVGNSYENQTKIMAPCAADKVRGDQDKEALGMRNVLLKVSLHTPIGFTTALCLQ